jgi:hypothetical protein
MSVTPLLCLARYIPEEELTWLLDNSEVSSGLRLEPHTERETSHGRTRRA